MLERIELLFQSLKDSVDSPFSAVDPNAVPSLEQTMVFVSDQLNDLLSIVNGTLDAASNFLQPKSSLDNRQGTITTTNNNNNGMYEQLVKELNVLDPNAMAAKENKIQEEARNELTSRLEIASLADIQVHHNQNVHY